MEERQIAHRRAFELIYEIQAGEPGAVESLRELTARAECENWAEVVRAGMFGDAVVAWLERDGGLKDALERLVARCHEDGDAVTLSLALAMRSTVGPTGEDPRSMSQDADLASAIVLLEHVPGGPMERISAHTACGIALGNRWLWELSDEQYAAALDIGAAEEPGSLDFLLAPIVYNRAEAQVSWASTLRQLDASSPELADRVRDFTVTMNVAERYVMPEGWRDELASLEVLLGALAGGDVADEARSRLERTVPPRSSNERGTGHLQLALALCEAASGGATARAMAELAAAQLDPDANPHEHDLALHVAAEVEASAGAGAGLRSSQRQFRQRWASRLATLETMRERIRVERRSIEHETMTRLAHLDDLTGAGNRRALQQYLESLDRRGSETICFILLDIDDFKAVNDRYGHAAGDEVLVRITRLVQRGVRPDDLVVRLGGDEFGLVLANITLEAANRRLESLAEQLDALSWAEIGGELRITLSIGVAGGDVQRVEELQRAADGALYEAKAAGGHRIVTRQLS